MGSCKRCGHIGDDPYECGCIAVPTCSGCGDELEPADVEQNDDLCRSCVAEPVGV